MVPLIQLGLIHVDQLGYGDGFQDQAGWTGDEAVPKGQSPSLVARTPAMGAIKSCERLGTTRMSFV